MDKTRLHVIDVSEFQGDIDWTRVKAAGIEGVIIRAAYSTYLIDSACDRNMEACERLDLPFGLYIYSMAKTAAQARDEADVILEKAKGHEIRFPLYIDLEQQGFGSYARMAAEAFGDRVERAGYRAGVYADQSWWETFLNGFDRYTKWVAAYGAEPAVAGMDMWQYTDRGSIPGISGYCDRDFCYVDFPRILENAHKSILTLAKEVIAGDWGNGEERRERLTAAGYDYAAVQEEVNRILETV